MTRNTINQSITELRQSSQHLQEQSLFAHRQAANIAARTQNLGADLAALDLETVFLQLRQMVAILSGTEHPVRGCADDQIAQAAE